MLLMYTHMHDPAMAWWYWYATTNCRIYIIQLHIVHDDDLTHIFSHLSLLYQPKTCYILCQQHCPTLHCISQQQPSPVSHHPKKCSSIFDLINLLTRSEELRIYLQCCTDHAISLKQMVDTERPTNTTLNHIPL